MRLDKTAEYIMASRIMGAILFVAIWAYAITNFGFLFGAGLGWIPAGILGWLGGRFWPLTVIGFYIAGLVYLSNGG